MAFGFVVARFGLFLRLLDKPGEQRGSRRTRDGRTPFVRQMQLVDWFGWPDPDISRLEGYWLRGDWANLLSQCAPEVLTAELIRRMATVWATITTEMRMPKRDKTNNKPSSEAKWSENTQAP